MESFPEFLRLERLPELKGGKLISMTWPREHIHPQSLACGKGTQDGQHGQHGIITAITEFETFVGHLTAPGSQLSEVDFKLQDVCPGAQGENFEDVALDCHDQNSVCQLLVLHSQGQKLSICPIPPNNGGSTQSMMNAMEDGSVTTDIGSWLNDGDAFVPPDATMPEHIVSFTRADKCPNGYVHCVYVQTSKYRLVEVVSEEGDAQDSEFFPIDSINVDTETGYFDRRGSLSTISDRYLGILVSGTRLVQVVDPEDGDLVSQFELPLPPKGQMWMSMCNIGPDMYALTDGPSPQLWQFPVPSQLRLVNHSAFQHTGSRKTMRGSGAASTQLQRQS